MLIAFGSEKSVSKCGIEAFDGRAMHVRYNNDVHPMDLVFDRDNERRMKEGGEWDDLEKLPVADQVKAAVALIVAAQAGFSAALVPLSTLLSTGIGLVPLLNNLQGTNYAGKKSRHILAHVVRFVPLPVSLSLVFSEAPDCGDVKSLDCLPATFQEGVIIDSNSLLFFPLPLVFRLSHVVRQSSGLIPTPALGRKQLSRGPGQSLKKIINHGASKKEEYYPGGKHTEGYDIPLSDSVFSWKTHFSATPKNDQSHLNLITKLTSGLLMLAALDDHPDAIIALQKRY
jgi:hypothetical protein